MESTIGNSPVSTCVLINPNGEGWDGMAQAQTNPRIKIKEALEGAVIEYDGSIEEAILNMGRLLDSRLGEICGEVKVLSRLIDHDRDLIAVSVYCEKPHHHVSFLIKVKRVELELHDVRTQ